MIRPAHSVRGLRPARVSPETARETVNGADPARAALAAIRAKAAEFRQEFSDEPRARTLEWAADRVERALAEADSERLPLAEASKRWGYSVGHLARLVRQGLIADCRPAGSKGRIYVRASDLPRRAIKAHHNSADVHELASRLYGGREGPSGHP